MKIAIYGDAAHTNSGAWCYAKTLEELGHSVVSLDDNRGLELYGRSLLGRAAHKLLRGPLELHRQRHAKLLVELVRHERPEIVIVLKGIHIGADDVQKMREAGAWVVNINHDDFFSLNRNNWSQTQRSAIPHYDFIFTTREVNVAELAPRNPRVEFFEFAYYPRIHRPVPVPEHERAQWTSDVTFVGTWEAERCALMEQLVREVPARYTIWGNSWEHANKRSPLQPYIQRRDVMGDDMAKVLGSAQISLAFLRKKNRDDYTQRTFEIPACDGVLLAERTERHQRYYREGVEADFFDPKRPDELFSKVRLLLSDAPRRDAMRAAGRAAVLRGRHTYRDRLERLLAVHAEAGAHGKR